MPDHPWTLPLSPDAEWLEADGRGGFASGTVSGERTRRYHALLLTATDPPTGRTVLVNGLETWLELPGGGGGDARRFLSTQRYDGDTLFPRGRDAVADFRPEPWPRWTFRWPDDAGGLTVEQEILVVPGAALTLVCWRLLGAAPGDGGARPILRVRPLLSGRDYHALHEENAAFNFRPQISGTHVVWRPYAGVPAILSWSNGEYRHEPEWYRRFLYREERARGLNCLEDLASPGVFSWTLGADGQEEPRAVLTLAAEGFDAGRVLSAATDEHGLFDAFARQEVVRRRRRLPAGRPPGPAATLAAAAEAYLVQGREGKTVIAGYPWFTDWGRDTFIALRGLCLATGRLEDAGEILARWAGTVSEGMLPNRFPDRGQALEFNSVDAALWFVVAAHEYLAAARGANAPSGHARLLSETVNAILEGYAAGTRFGIALDPADGLLRSGVGHPDLALTWMDARPDGARPVTRRAGKPVEVQALWLNALHLAGAADPGSRWRPIFEQGLLSFHDRFWMPESGRRFLRDVVDVDGHAGADDERFRPNQIFAVGGLPLCLLPGDAACAVVSAVQDKLLTPLGLRTLAPGDPDYAPRYEGDPAERDARYHQGTVWPWLLGPFAEAWVRVHGDTKEVKSFARSCFLDPLLAQVGAAGLGHLPEIADGAAPHAPRGCPFQAWSVGEALRLDRVVLA